MIIKKFVDSYCSVNTYVVNDENTNEAIVVDPGGSLEGVLDYIAENKLDVKYIVLTHGHGDHIGYVKALNNELNSKIVANENEKEMLNDDSKNMSRRMKCGSQMIDADIYVKDGDSLKFGNLNMKFIYTPGHTRGGMCIKIDDEMFTGDTLFAGSIGRMDLFSASSDEMEESLEKLCKYDDCIKIYPGHGPSSTLGIEKKSNPYLK